MRRCWFSRKGFPFCLLVLLMGTVMISLHHLYFVTNNFMRKTNPYVLDMRYEDVTIHKNNSRKENDYPLSHERGKHRNVFSFHNLMLNQRLAASKKRFRALSLALTKELNADAFSDEEDLLGKSHVSKQSSTKNTDFSRLFSKGMLYVVRRIQTKYPFVFDNFFLSDPFFAKYRSKTNVGNFEASNTYKCKPTYSNAVYSKPRSNQKCSEKINIAFLKIHKCGSTTITNILQRFALKRNVNVILPLKPKSEFLNNVFGYNGFFLKDMVIPVPKGQTFNMIFNHIVYNRQVFHQLLPDNTFYFAIIRRPLTRFMSVFNYFPLVDSMTTTKAVKRELGVENVNYPYKSVSKVIQKQIYYSGIHNFIRNMSVLRDKRMFKYTFNGVAYDFGIPLHKMDDLDFVREYIKELDRDFQFVLIMEHFDVSLILLKRFLCWTHKDIMYIPHLKYGKILSVTDLSPEDVGLLRTLQQADAMIFEHFNQTLWRRVAAAGPGLFDEVKTFQNIRKSVVTFCSDPSNGTLCVNATVWNEEFYVTTEDCDQIMAPETRLNDVLVDRAVDKVKDQEEPDFLYRFTDYIEKWYNNVY